jgi:hypothetical protein
MEGVGEAAMYVVVALVMVFLVWKWGHLMSGICGGR